VTGKRGPVTGSLHGKKPGPEADPERQKRLGRPGSKAKVPAKRARTTTEIFQAVNTDPPAPPDGLGPIGAAVWTDVWEALPILSPKLDHSAVLSFCLASEDAVRLERRLTSTVCSFPRSWETPGAANLGPGWSSTQQKRPSDALTRSCSSSVTAWD